MRMLILVCAIWFCATALPWAQTAAPPTTSPNGTPAASAASSTATTPAEAELGKETAKEIEKDYKLVKDEKKLARLNAMAAEIAPQTQRPDVKYTIKIIDSPEINALSIPGGIIYFTSGLLNAAESDDELAGVMAHEIAHNALYHLNKLKNKEKKDFIPQLLGTFLLTMLNSKDPNSEVSPFHIIAAGEMVKQSLLNGYSKELEAEADINSVRYLAKVKKYDPVGIYSVLLGFRDMEDGLPQDKWSNYLENHPRATERLATIKGELKVEKHPINLWRVVNFRASVTPPKDGATGHALMLGSTEIVMLYAVDGEMDSAARAASAAEVINQQLTRLGTALKFYDFQIALGETKAILTVSNSPVVTLLPGDIGPTGTLTLTTLAESVKRNLVRAMQGEQLKRKWQATDFLY